jgi:hypothetical protein
VPEVLLSGDHAAIERWRQSQMVERTRVRRPDLLERPLGGIPRPTSQTADGGQAQDAQGFARGLQQAGYATDPSYADKLVRVINSTTMRQSLAYAPPAQPLPQMLAQR